MIFVSVHGSTGVWNKSPLTLACGTRLLKLVQFYSDHAMLCPNLLDQPVQPDTAVPEHVITHGICLLRLTGRSESYACTVITTLGFDLVKNVLLARNIDYNETGQNGLLAVDKVLSMTTSINIDPASKLFNASCLN